MPELPDVETFRTYLNATALHQKIKTVEVLDSQMLQGVSVSTLKGHLRGRQFRRSYRHGKNLFAETTGDEFVRLHFGMTGYLKYYKNADQSLHHLRVRFDFSNGYHLAYICQRRLGNVSLENDIEQFVQQNDLGPDVLDISIDDFIAAAHSTKKAIKSLLTDQKKMAGVGNVYADEVLFKSRVHPQTTTRQLDRTQLKKIYQMMHTVLDYAIDHQADPKQFARSYLLPHRVKGAKCPNCGGSIKQVRISGRTSYFCPVCQKK